VAEALVQRGLIRTPLDLFRLGLPELAALNLGSEEEPRRFGEKNAARALAALEKAKSMPLERWLTALGIPGIGAVTARTVARYQRSAEELATGDFLPLLVALEDKLARYHALNPRSPQNKGGDKEALEAERAQLLAEMQAEAEPYAARGYLSLEPNAAGRLSLNNPIGSVATRALLRYFRSAAGRELLDTLAQLGIAARSDSYEENMRLQAAGALAGKVLVLTGALSRPRPEFERLIAEAGGKATGSVTKKTTYLVAGEGGGSKRDKALKLGIPIIDEAALLALLRGETFSVSSAPSPDSSSEPESR
ncbi:MAG: BRCT domain-containing protein, partial [Akkermansia sp.]